MKSQRNTNNNNKRYSHQLLFRIRETLLTVAIPLEHSGRILRSRNTIELNTKEPKDRNSKANKKNRRRDTLHVVYNIIYIYTVFIQLCYYDIHNC